MNTAKNVKNKNRVIHAYTYLKIASIYKHRNTLILKQFKNHRIQAKRRHLKGFRSYFKGVLEALSASCGGFSMSNSR